MHKLVAYGRRAALPVPQANPPHGEGALAQLAPKAGRMAPKKGETCTMSGAERKAYD